MTAWITARRAAIAGPQGHPVPDRRQVGRAAGLVTEAAGRLGEGLARVGADPQVPRVAAHDAARHETLGGERREGLRERFGVAEFAEARPRSSRRQPRRSWKAPMKSASARADSIGQAL